MGIFSRSKKRITMVGVCEDCGSNLTQTASHTCAIKEGPYRGISPRKTLRQEVEERASAFANSFEANAPKLAAAIAPVLRSEILRLAARGEREHAFNLKGIIDMASANHQGTLSTTSDLLLLHINKLFRGEGVKFWLSWGGGSAPENLCYKIK